MFRLNAFLKEKNEDFHSNKPKDVEEVQNKFEPTWEIFISSLFIRLK